jgi:hypothetical protein
MKTRNGTWGGTSIFWKFDTRNTEGRISLVIASTEILTCEISEKLRSVNSRNGLSDTYINNFTYVKVSEFGLPGNLSARPPVCADPES